ncbi:MULTISPECIES: acyl-CoA dehydrogenase family protein [unclassified Isoptericola]|uniref:acyl-CoA dehydrogenase family protein n=1 Tax=unclassified Isoptericola TaxID=2623355 RepID=UPI0027138966|nr:MULTISPECIES: acyl-CoA dehydrogenase family protein [unclassified Isoptericola]MDO8147158.1 acyl-CoA dehydrogenase family protein [Isoptericola sp. b515]MDO8150526.1 acyl-CoA dehydrogenase family protein [Isoptericola sp. b408]
MIHETSSTALTDRQRKLSQTVREFADEVVAPAAYQYDTERRLPIEIIHQMGEMGLFGLPFPTEVGGQGEDYVSLCLAVEALARVDQSIAVTLEAGVGLGIMPIFRHGTDAQREEWLPDLVSGRTLGAFGLTEAGAGSDAGATRTTARLDGDEWVIDGSKQFITNSGTPITSLITITAVTDRYEDGSPELSTILVPSGTPGLTVGESYDKVGWHTSDTHPLTLEGVRVPRTNLLGERGRGYANFLRALDEGRIAFAALATGAAQGCLEEAVRYAKERQVFGHSIGRHQHVAFTIARMQARVQAARLCWLDAAQKMIHGKPFKAEASVAKLTSGEAAMANARDASQIFGGYGFLNENPVARHYRDAKVLEVGEGTTEVQLMIIARDLGFTA